MRPRISRSGNITKFATDYQMGANIIKLIVVNVEGKLASECQLIAEDVLTSLRTFFFFTWLSMTNSPTPKTMIAVISKSITLCFSLFTWLEQDISTRKCHHFHILKIGWMKICMPLPFSSESMPAQTPVIQPDTVIEPRNQKLESKHRIKPERQKSQV